MDIQMKKYEDNFAEAVMAGKLSHNGKDRRGRRGWVQEGGKNGWTEEENDAWVSGKVLV